MRTGRRYLAVMALVIWAGLPILARAAEATTATRSFYMGFTPFPWDISARAVKETDAFLLNNGDLVAHHFDGGVPWTEALADKPYHADFEGDWQRRKAFRPKLKVLVSVTPLNGGRNGMALYRGKSENMPLPKEFQGKPLDDPIVRKAYLNYCRRVVSEFQPDYLAIGIEVNELIHNSPGQWPGFVQLYKDVYAQLKKENPQLPIFATITLHNLTNPGWKDRDAQQKKIRDFLALNDIAGVSYYPFMAGQSERPVETFDWLRKFTDKPIAVTETGYPAETIKLKSLKLAIPADPAKQAAYYETLLERAQRDRYLFVVAFLHRDYDALWKRIGPMAPEAFIVWKDCGLLDEAGTPRPAYKIWKQWQKRPYDRAP